LLIKAAAGGGGRGMRKVTKTIELLDAIQGARREALAGFGNSKLLLEKFFEDGRHIEVQVIGDSSGDVRQLGERDCSIQRRYQKLIEESPAPNIKAIIRAQLFEHAIKLAHAANLLGVSTVEFLVNSKEIIFLEVNTRLQVEHPVTEEMLGIDLVELQLRMAKGDKLSECLPKKFLSKAAIEVRIVSEGPDFVPTTGVIRELSLPNNIRIEHALFKGLRVTGEFDSLLGKIIAVGDTREAAIKELRAALDDTKIVGLSTNIDFLKQVLEDKDFLAGKPSAQIVEKVAKSLTTKFDLKYAEAAVYALEQDDTEPLRLIGENKLSHKYLVTCEGKEFLVSAPVKAQSKFLTKVISPKEVLVEDKLVLLEIIHPTSKLVAGVLAEDRALRASLSGKIISINCAVGEQVKSGQVLVVIESMKMEHSLKVKADGVVKSVYVTQGQSVQAKALLIELDA